MFPFIFPQRIELTNLYKNTGGDTELRIASYRAMMQCLDEDVLQVVVDTMMVEEDEQGGLETQMEMLNFQSLFSFKKFNIKSSSTFP